MYRLKNLFLVLSMIVLSISAFAWDWNDVNVLGTAGSGSNTALCVLDFGVNEYSFAYQFDGTKTSFDMLQAIDALPGVTFEYIDTIWGHQISAFGYDGLYQQAGTNWGDPYWGQWVGVIGGSFDYNTAMGADYTTLSNNHMEAWTWEATGSWPPVNSPSVPEPATIGMVIGLGLLAVGKRIRK